MDNNFSIKTLCNNLSLDRLGAMIPLIMWVLYCLLSPIYVFDSGLPQPADYVMIIALYALVKYAIACKQLPIKSYHRSIIIPAFGFVLYVVLLSLFWSFKLSETAILWSPVYYGYDVIVLTMGLVLGAIYREQFLKFTVLATTIIIIIQIMYMFIAEDYGFYMRGTGYAIRGTGFFSNPNQFGYFALLAMMITVSSIWVGAIGYRLGMIAVSACVFAAVLSMSYAANLALAIFIFLLLLYRFSIVIISGIIIVILIAYLAIDPSIIEAKISMLQSKFVAANDFYLPRGYFRIYEYPKYLLLGAGEGAVYRFGTEREFHSTIGTLLFCYGIPGTILFFSMIWRIIRINISCGFIFIAPPLIYGIAHQGLRFTFFWVTLSCISLAIYLDACRQERKIIQDTEN